MLDKDELKQLIKQPQDICVSIYMPTHRVRLERQQEDQIRLRNLIKKAERQLADVVPELRFLDVKELMEPAAKLLQQNGSFWKHTEDSLAIFLAQDFSRIYRLPLKMAELVVTANHFYIKPVLPLLNGDGRFYILSLSQKEVRLLGATRDTVHEIELKNIPLGLADTLKWDDPERQLQWHTGTGATMGRGQAAIFHGHGVGSAEVHKNNLLRYLQQVAVGLQDTLIRQKAPLLLAGVDYLLAMYREVNQYPYLLEEEIKGSPKAVTTTELHQKAWKIMQPKFQEVQTRAVEQFWQLVNTKRASSYLRQIIVAAYEGRVETLFTAVDQQDWGTFDEQTGYIGLHETAELHDEDLLNLAAINTFLNGGMVYAIPAQDVPGGTNVAAIFRY